MSSVKRSFVSGFLWSLLGQGGYLSINLLTSIALARLLTPYEFGQVGIVMFFITISKVLTESGLSGALIRKKDANEDDFSTVFVFNLLVSVVLMLTLIMSSGFIASFYDDIALQNILIALSFVLVINAFQFTQNAKIVKALKFKKQALYTFCSVCFGSLLGVSLAYWGLGVWSLIIMQLTNAFVLTIIYRIFEGSAGKFVFKIDSFKTVYKFGLNTTIASIINTAFDNIYSLILGKYFAIQQTGLYYQAKKLQEIPVGVIKSSTLGVVFSTLSGLQDDKKKFDGLYSNIVTSFTVLVGFICLIIFLYAEQVVLILYGEKWLGAVFYMKVLVIASYFYMQEMFNRVLFKIFDRTDKILLLEIIKVLIMAVSILVGIREKDIELLLYGFLATSVLSYFINYYHSRTVYNGFSWMEVFLTLKVICIGTAITLIIESIKNFFSLDVYAMLLLFPLVTLLYIIFLRMFKVTNVVKDTKILLTMLKRG
ncbi:lipopolysaccharide biosynthesis protein [Sphingobacterium chuzhouense]|uniref:Lipopolysaccharide biosynthesis protein n=1 Tax=Sphingobacterium chuzhouense TaxID=1742264 RepID=A0ABR7XXI2_9SPHI|nr:lipopolysaccharide biosynthesis protein [Sphingobacterium chuzhouense]MBD1423776.1 lipopolysaccharide biosynthesis protein [Sphingobacterium chuzhouense]